MNLAIIYGGTSNEREISLKTGESIIESIDNKYNVYPIEFNGDYSNLYLKVKKNNIDLIFNALHGGDGENGKFQNFLEKNNLKFTGSNSLSSKIAMDKNKTKKICFENLIPTPKWDYINFDKIKLEELNYKDIIDRYKKNCVIKPANDGSSIGMTIIQNNLSKDKIYNGLEKCIAISKKVIIEEYIEGREFTASILNNQILPIVEIIPKSKFYDYNSKYTKGKCDYRVPAKISNDVQSNINKYALKLNKIIGCRHYSRVDLRVDNNDNIYLLEINTLPGMTDTSLFPKSALKYGLEYKDLIEEIITLAKK